MFPVLIHLRNDERLLKPGMNTEVEIEIAQKQNAVVIPNDAVVAVRDANTAGAALGISEDAMRAAMEKLRENMRTQFAGAAPAAGAARVAGAGGTAGAAQVSPECEALRAKVRAAGGPDGLSDAERGKLRACFAGARRQSSGEAGPPTAQRAQAGTRGVFAGGAGGRRAPTTRRAMVFVPGQTGPEPRMVTLGVNDWDYTEVINGVQPGEQVFLMTAARLQQQQKELADRVRQRSNQMGGMRQSTAPQSGQGGR
jgi:HlyD family secretion protein